MLCRFLFFLIACTLFACNNADKQSSETNTDSTTVNTSGDSAITGISNYSGCFVSISGRDTALINLDIRDSVVNGTLQYHWSEKDHNNGRIKGVLRDSLIIASYDFRSEGVMSVRQVAFRLHQGQLIEGYGELEQRRDSIFFKNTDTLQYLTERPFSKVDCGEVAEMMKKVGG